MHVAPRVGAWIETSIFPLCSTLHTSHPEWVRGLKHPCGDNTISGHIKVAPRVGAWIETPVRVDIQNLLKCRTPSGCVD